MKLKKTNFWDGSLPTKAHPYTEKVIDYLEKLRAEKAKRLAKEGPTKLSIVCEHLLFEATPINKKNAVCFKVKEPHEKHDGNIFVCEVCERVFGENISDRICLAERKVFEANLSRIKNV